LDVTKDLAQSQARSVLIDRLFDLFRHSGFEGVSISDISAATGLGKSSLYHHFPGGKTDMAAAVLERAGAWLQDEIVAALREPEAPRAQRIDRMLAALDSLYCSGAKPCILASMLLGSADGQLGSTVSAAFRRWRESLVLALTETGLNEATAQGRATSAIIQIEGALILSRALGDPSVFRQALESTRDMLLG
jgi:AcrR family transcriptional regulator